MSDPTANGSSNDPSNAPDNRGGNSGEEQPKSPEEILAEKQNALANAETNVSTLKAEITWLTKTIADLAQASDAYEKFYADAIKLQSGIGEKIDDQISMAKSVITNDEAAAIQKGIANGITAFDKQLADLGTSVKSARAALNTAKTDLSTKDAEFQDSQVKWDDIQKLQKTIDAQLKEAQNLTVLAEKAHDSDDHKQMYLLAQIAKQAVSDTLKIPEPSQFKTDLSSAKTDVDGKKSAAETSKGDVEQKSANYAKLAKQYDAARASRLTDLLKQLKTIKP